MHRIVNGVREQILVNTVRVSPRYFIKWLFIFSYIADSDVGDLLDSWEWLGDLSAS